MLHASAVFHPGNYAVWTAVAMRPLQYTLKLYVHCPRVGVLLLVASSAVCCTHTGGA